MAEQVDQVSVTGAESWVAIESMTKRPTSPGAEMWLGKDIPVLDHGSVMLIDYMGNDISIEQAARMSYGAGTRKVSETIGLIRYLLRHDHTTPFEMIEVKFSCRMPMFVARQWIRHRTANVNEYSARYSKVKDVFYIPVDEDIQLQSTDNKQGRGHQADDATRQKVRDYMIMDAEAAYQHYTEMIDELGVARELARANLPVNFYTEWCWKIDLHNLLRFLWLRLDPHAQYEIRVFAEAISKVIAEAFPIAWQAFVDYELDAVKVTRLEIEMVRAAGQVLTFDVLAQSVVDLELTNARERREALTKLVNKFNLVKPGTRAEFDQQYAAVIGLTEKGSATEFAEFERLGLIVA